MTKTCVECPASLLCTSGEDIVMILRDNEELTAEVYFPRERFKNIFGPGDILLSNCRPVCYAPQDCPSVIRGMIDGKHVAQIVSHVYVPTGCIRSIEGHKVFDAHGDGFTRR